MEIALLDPYTLNCLVCYAHHEVGKISIQYYFMVSLKEAVDSVHFFCDEMELFVKENKLRTNWSEKQKRDYQVEISIIIITICDERQSHKQNIPNNRQFQE